MELTDRRGCLKYGCACISITACTHLRRRRRHLLPRPHQTRRPRSADTRTQRAVRTRRIRKGGTQSWRMRAAWGPGKDPRRRRHFRRGRQLQPSTMRRRDHRLWQLVHLRWPQRPPQARRSRRSGRGIRAFPGIPCRRPSAGRLRCLQSHVHDDAEAETSERVLLRQRRQVQPSEGKVLPPSLFTGLERTSTDAITDLARTPPCPCAPFPGETLLVLLPPMGARWMSRA